jgi:hypothetical protein
VYSRKKNNDLSLNKVVTKARRDLGKFPPGTNLLVVSFD